MWKQSCLSLGALMIKTRAWTIPAAFKQHWFISISFFFLFPFVRSCFGLWAVLHLHSAPAALSVQHIAPSWWNIPVQIHVSQFDSELVHEIRRIPVLQKVESRRGFCHFTPPLLHLIFFFFIIAVCDRNTAREQKAQPHCHVGGVEQLLWNSVNVSTENKACSHCLLCTALFAT